MKSAQEHLEQMRDVALKVITRIDQAMEKGRGGAPIGGELQSIHDGARNLYAMQEEHRILYGIGGPEPVGFLNVAGLTVRQDPGIPSGRVDFVQDGKVAGRITNIGEDA